MNYESDREIRRQVLNDDDATAETDERETHATTGGAAAAGAVTGGVIGLTGGPVGAAIGAVGGAIVGAAAERMMHSEDEAPPGTAPLTDSSTPRTEYVENTPTTRGRLDTPPTEIEEPVGEPLAELPDTDTRSRL
jgi:hypothetical protein